MYAMFLSCAPLSVESELYDHLRQTPRDVVRLLRTELAKFFKDRPEEVHIDYVTRIRDFNTQLPAATSLYGAFRKRKEDDESTIIPHSFTYVRRERALAETAVVCCALQCCIYHGPVSKVCLIVFSMEPGRTCRDDMADMMVMFLRL